MEMTLDELKKQNQDEEAPKEVKQEEKPKDGLEDGIELEDPEPSIESEDKPKEDEIDWLSSDDKMPVSAHVKIKHKLKAKLSDAKDRENELLSKIESLEKKIDTRQVVAASEPNSRPKRDDFDTTEEYDAAVDIYFEKMFDNKLQTYASQTKESDNQIRARETVAKEVDMHYARAEKLISDTGISPDVYRAADQTVREAVDAVLPGRGDVVTDALISMVGDGSEKAFPFLGRNKTALAEFQSLLIADKSGMKAAIYLGQLKERLTNPKKLKSNAPKPAAEINGDTPNVTETDAKLKKQYDAAHEKGDTQKAFDIRRKAKKLAREQKRELSW